MAEIQAKQVAMGGKKENNDSISDENIITTPKKDVLAIGQLAKTRTTRTTLIMLLVLLLAIHLQLEILAQ